MQLSSPHPYRDRLYLLAFTLFLGSSCGGGGCACMTPLTNGFPPEQRQPNSAQARLSESGVAFMEANASSLVGALLPGGTTFTIPPACENQGASTPLCCSDDTPDMCQIDLDLDPQPGDQARLELTPIAPSKLGLVLRARVKSLQDITVKTSGIQCRVSLDTTDGGNDSVRINAEIVFRQDGATYMNQALGTTVVEIVEGSVTIDDLDNGDISLGGGFLCTLADIFLKGTIVDQVRTLFAGQLGGLISGQLCKSCVSDGDCAPFATCGVGGTCQVTGADPARCLQELGITGRMAASNLLSSLSPGLTGALDLYLVAGGYVQAGDANGLSLGLLGGAVPADARHDNCVPVVPQPQQQQIPESALLKGNVRPDNQPFDLGIGIHQQFLDRAAWAAYDSGFLCLNVGTRTAAILNTDTFANILVPSLGDLLGGQVSPIILGLRPQQAPTFELGAGTFTPTGEIDQPLMTVHMNELEIDFYAFIDERYARIFTVRTDLALPLGLEVNDAGQIAPVLGDATSAFQNIVVTNSELLTETAAEIGLKFPAVLSFAVPLIAGSLAPIDLPAVVGLELNITPGGLTSIENNSMLAIFANLSVAGAKPGVARVDTRAEIVHVRTPATEVFSRRGALARADRPSVELLLDGADPSGARVELEWQFQIDRAPWSPWTTQRQPTLGRDGFWLQGRHEILVRARIAGQPETVDDTPVELVAIIDSIAPSVTLTDAGDAVTVEASDKVSAADALAIEYRFEGGEWRSAGAPPLSIALGAQEAIALEVRVRDEAGNVGVATGLTAGFHGRAPAGSSGCDCRVGERDRAPRGAWFLGALGVLGLVSFGAWRRRDARARVLPFVAALALIALAASACGGDIGGGDDDAPVPGLQPGALGRYLDMASQDGRVVVVGYEDKYGDLVLGDVEADGDVNVKPIDGVPAGAPVVENPAGYRGGVEQRGEDVGAYASVVLVGGQARVAYQHVDDRILLYGAEAGQGSWDRHVVDPAVDGEVVGYYNSLSVDASGVPGIAYLATVVPDGMGGFKSQLRWAQAGTATPTGSTDWSITVVHEAGIPCGGLCDDTTFACVTATNQCAMVETTCATACVAATEACVAGACVPVSAAPVVEDLPEGPGLFASAGRTAAGDPVVAFYDRTGGDLHLATFAAGTWTVTPVVVAAESDMGQWASLAVGEDGVVHLAFQDALADSLRYVAVTGGAVGGIEMVDDGQRADRPHPVGAAAHLFFDASGALAVAYQDSATNDLVLARRGEGGVWTHEDFLAGEVGYGFYNGAAVDGSKTWLGTFAYDRDKFPPGEVIVSDVP